MPGSNRKEISFRTEPARRKAGRRSYYERVTRCDSKTHVNADSGGEQDLLYVSRAYLSNAMFVYHHVFTDGRIYLKNLSTNVGIVDELNLLDFFED